jgi:hypothetical protein
MTTLLQVFWYWDQNGKTPENLGVLWRTKIETSYILQWVIAMQNEL